MSQRDTFYYIRLALYAIAENQIGKLGTPKLAILPSPQALTETAWKALLAYVSAGGNLPITGPLDRDEHWQKRKDSRCQVRILNRCGRVQTSKGGAGLQACI